MPVNWSSLLGFALCSLLLIGCGGQAPASRLSPTDSSKVAQPKLFVVASTSVIADLARNVGGERAEVVSLIPPGSDPHTFQPKPQDAVNVTRARLVFQNGLGLDEVVRKLIETNLRNDALNLVLTDGIDPLMVAGYEDEQGDDDKDEQGDDDKDEHGDDDKDEHGGDEATLQGDPHLWLDPQLAIIYVEKIRDGLSRIDPDGRSVYEKNAATYISEIRELDRWIGEQIATVPKENRKLVTTHQSFGYFARRYDLEQTGFVVKSPGREPSAGEVAELVTRLKKLKVKMVYREPQLSAENRVLETIAKEAGVRVGELYSDSLDQRAPTYTAMMRFNTEQVVKGLR